MELIENTIKSYIKGEQIDFQITIIGFIVCIKQFKSISSWVNLSKFYKHIKHDENTITI